MSFMVDLTKNLKNMAVKMNGFKANILIIADGKKPDGQWKEWMQKPQTIRDLVQFDFNKAKGLGVVSGINDWHVFDFDKVTNPDVIKIVIRKLGFPAAYKWVVRSGSGQGYHVHFRCSTEFPSEQINKKPTGVYQGKSLDGSCDHIELRWANCQTLIPPSLHESGNNYEFVNGEPENAPNYTDAGRVLEAYKAVCVIEEEKKPEEKPQDNKSSAAADKDLEFLPSALEFLSERLVDYNDWLKCGWALASMGEAGRKHFMELSLKNPNYPQDTPEIINRKFDSLLKDKSNHVKLSSLFHVAKMHGYQYPKKSKKRKERPEGKQDKVKHTQFQEDFWFEFFNPATGNMALGIDRANFLYFLQTKGFYKMYMGFDYIFIRIQKNIVKKVSSTLIKDFCLEFIKTLPGELTANFTNIDLYNVLLKGSNVYFSASFLEFLEPKEVSFHRDKIDKAYFYFKNCWVEVTRETYNTFPYEKLQGYIWEKQIIDRNFIDVKQNIEDYVISEFQEFLKNVCNHDLDRYYTLKSAIGYLLHTYKDPSVAKAIIFCDEQLSDDANGRSGKSLVGHALSKFRNSVRFDGRNFKQDKSFIFQQIGPDTQLIEFNDVDKKFDFEKLFSIITDSITVEKKNKDEFIITYDKSPKILISTNYTIQSDGDSADDRKFEIEFSNHYNKNHKPVDEFKHRFFDEWDVQEWNRFDNFMIESVNYFLQKGLKPYSFINLKTKKLQQATNREFIDFMDSEMSNNVEYNKKSALEKFIQMYPDYSMTKQNKFTYWLKKYARINELKYEERKSKEVRYFMLIDGKIPGLTLLKDKVEERGQSSDSLFP